jgi:hypothetical protein
MVASASQQGSRVGVSVIASVAVLLLSVASKAADNTACWGDATRVEISCTPLTEKLLSSLKFASRQRVMKVMKAEGRPLSPDEADTLHFISNAKRGDVETGILNLTFRDDRVVIIHALIDQPGQPLEYLWNVELGGCSDFPGSNEKCNK